MKHKILTFFLACLVPWLAGAQQSANSQNNVAEKDYIAYWWLPIWFLTMDGIPIVPWCC